MAEITTILIVAGACFTAGYFVGKSKAYNSVDLSGQSASLNSLTTQIAEMKGKFSEIEKSREKIDKEREKTDEQKEKRMKEWMGSTNKLFEEIGNKTIKSDEEKEKRIKEWMGNTEKFFKEQKQDTEKFLEQQGKSRDEIEKRRDAQIEDMKKLIEQFTKTISGTKTRGIIGEDLLKDVLSNSIKAGVVEYNLTTDGGIVEFGWNLDDGKYIPIDSKLPDVFELLEQYHLSEDYNDKRSLKKEITEKIKKEIKRVQKYQNQSNTIDNCLLVVPEGILEIAPELVSLGKDDNVFICSYKDVFPIAHVLQEQYVRLKEEGDIGQYKQMVKVLFQILEKINKKTETIEKAITQVKNANEEIKDQINKGKRGELDNE